MALIYDMELGKHWDDEMMAAFVSEIEGQMDKTDVKTAFEAANDNEVKEITAIWNNWTAGVAIKQREH